jgi:hypothetical protein
MSMSWTPKNVVLGVWLTWLALLALPISTFGQVAAAEPMSVSQLLPVGTRAYFVVPNPHDLEAGWKATRLSALGEDAAMKPFLEAAGEAFDEAVGDLHSFSDVTLSDLQSAARGEVSLALVERSGAEKPAVVALADVDGSGSAVKSLIARIDEGLKRRGASAATRDAAGTAVHTYRWKGRDGEPRSSAYFVKGDLLAVSSDLTLVDGVLARSGSPGEESLATVASFRDIKLRCDAEAGGLAPQLRWYLEPLANARLTTGKEPEFALKHGFGGVKAVGGTLNFNAPGYEVLSRVVVYAPPPRERALRAAALVEGAHPAPPPWLIDDLDSYVDMNLNLRELVDTVGGLFDDLVADGIEGTFEDILGDLAAEDGPGVDVRRDLLPIVGPRVMFVSDHTEPHTPDSTRTVIAVATSHEAAAAEIVEHLMRDDPDVSRIELPGYPYPLWQVSDSETASMPNMGMMVANGFILTSSKGALIRKLLGAPAEAPKLADAADYKRVAEEMGKLGGAGASLRLFSRQHRDFATTYALLREGRLAEVESVYGDLVRRLFGDDEDRLSGLPRLDFGTLPEFTAVTPFLGTQGIFIKNQTNGWTIVGFVPK